VTDCTGMSALYRAARGVPARRTALAAAVLVWAAVAVAGAEPPPPALALGRLKAGNDRFATNASAPLALGAPARQALAQTQAPFAMVLSCADARVPPEIIFNTGLGELFVVRSLGGVADRAVIASLEHGAVQLHVPLLVVMGHESCDVVRDATGAGDGIGPNQQYLWKAIRAGASRPAGEQQELRAAILANIEQVTNDVLAGSESLRQAVSAGRLQVVGAYYELVSGRVIFSEPVTATATAARER
jgi:carbonic anhydrase